MCPATPPLCHPQLSFSLFLFAPVTVTNIFISRFFLMTHCWCCDWFRPETKALIRIFFVSLWVSFQTVLYAIGIYRLGLGLLYQTCHFHLCIIFLPCTVWYHTACLDSTSCSLNEIPFILRVNITDLAHCQPEEGIRRRFVLSCSARALPSFAPPCVFSAHSPYQD